MHILKEKRGQAIKEFELGEKSSYWNPVSSSIQNNKLAEYLKVSNSALCRWYHDWKLKKTDDNNKSTHTNPFNYHAVTQSQKDCALRHFNILEKSRHWNSKYNCLNLKLLREECKVSDWTIRYWYAVWKLDHNTKLEFTPLSEVDYAYNRQQYFNELINKTGLNTFDAMAKYNIGSSVLKKWNLEFKALTNKALLNNPILVAKEQTEKKPEPVIKVEYKEQPIVSSNPIDTIEKFFNGLAELITKAKQTELELNTYKQRCEKWATRIVELQNALIKKD